MSDTRADDINKVVGNVDGQLVVRRAKKLALLSIPIPSWPEKIWPFLSIVFVTSVAYAPRDDAIAKVLITGLFMATIGCLWFVTNKLREKVEVLSEIARESNP